MTALAGLVKIELPASTVRLCDGGLVIWGAETFTAKDATFGTVGGLDGLTEGVGDEVPALSMRLIPANDALPGDLVQPGFQTARVRFWIAEVDPATSSVVGTPDLQFDGQLDQGTLSIGKDSRDLEFTVVSMAERLFNRAEGNSLSPTFHKSVWSGETGHDQANGLTIAVAWGAEQTATTSGGFYGGFGGFGGGFMRDRTAIQ
jgi:hypothetical protein